MLRSIDTRAIRREDLPWLPQQHPDRVPPPLVIARRLLDGDEQFGDGKLRNRAGVWRCRQGAAGWRVVSEDELTEWLSARQPSNRPRGWPSVNALLDAMALLTFVR